MGVATNALPQYMIPSYIGSHFKSGAATTSITKKSSLEELDFLIGDECLGNPKAYPPERFMAHGIVTNWDLLEKFYQQCYYRYLRINPEEYNVILVCFLLLFYE